MKDKVPHVSIVIPTLNEASYVPKLLDSLTQVTQPIEVIIVDGNSSDTTQQVALEYQSKYPHLSLKLLTSPERGISLQRNLGAEQAQSEILMFVDADVVFTEAKEFVKIVEIFTVTQAAVATPLLRPLEPGLGYRIAFWVARLVQRGMYIVGKPYFGGACLLTTKRVFTRVRGFDTTIKLAEDIDYSLRAAALGSFLIINIYIATSARRIIKYGYWSLIKEIPKIVPILFTGKIINRDIHYPFGEY
jgi:glycosyltransferase involved in cell wall biosynthesis